MDKPMSAEEIEFVRRRVDAIPGYWFSTGHGDIQIETEDGRFLSFPNAEGKNWCEVFRVVHAAAMHTDRAEPYIAFVLSAADDTRRLLATLDARDEEIARARRDAHTMHQQLQECAMASNCNACRAVAGTIPGVPYGEPLKDMRARAEAAERDAERFRALLGKCVAAWDREPGLRIQEPDFIRKARAALSGGEKGGAG